MKESVEMSKCLETKKFHTVRLFMRSTSIFQHALRSTPLFQHALRSTSVFQHVTLSTLLLKHVIHSTYIIVRKLLKVTK